MTESRHPHPLREHLPRDKGHIMCAHAVFHLVFTTTHGEYWNHPIIIDEKTKEEKEELFCPIAQPVNGGARILACSYSVTLGQDWQTPTVKDQVGHIRLMAVSSFVVSTHYYISRTAVDNT